MELSESCHCIMPRASGVRVEVAKENRDGCTKLTRRCRATCLGSRNISKEINVCHVALNCRGLC